MMLRNSLIFLFLWLASDARGQLLWKASKASEPSFHLFGTMHLAAGNFLAEHEAVKQAIEESETVFTEVDLDVSGLQSIITDYVFLPDGMDLTDSLTEDEIQRLDSFLALLGNPYLSVKTLSRAKPMYIQVLLTSMMFKADTTQTDTFGSVDGQVVKYARLYNKELGYLETQEEQLQYLFNDPDLGLQFRMLRKSLYNIDQKDSLSELFLKLPQIYRSQELDKIQQILQAATVGSVDEADLLKSLLGDRNKRWVEKIIAFNQAGKGSGFYAVGAGHLPGEDGLIALLREQGYTVEPVLNP